MIRPWMVRRACLDRVGILDEAFVPTEWDEADLACRIREAGWKVATCGYERLGAYEHLGSSTVGALGDAYKARVLKNGLLFHERWSHVTARDHARARRTWRRQATPAGWLRTLMKAAGQWRSAHPECLPMLKAVRNAAASAAAWTLYHAPALERPYAHAAHAALGVPGVHTVFRETTDRARSAACGGKPLGQARPHGSLSPLGTSASSGQGLLFRRRALRTRRDQCGVNAGEGDVFVDIGANSGYPPVLAALRVGARGRVFAFEPNPPSGGSWSVISGSMRSRIA